MKIEIRKIVRPIDLADYAPEYADADQQIHVWVNPPRQARVDYYEINQEFSAAANERLALLQAVAKKVAEESEEDIDPGDLTLDELDLGEDVQGTLADIDAKLEALARRLYGWFAEMWSQGEEQWTTDDVITVVEACLDADPALWNWIQDEHWRLVREHRDGVKKK